MELFLLGTRLDGRYKVLTKKFIQKVQKSSICGDEIPAPVLRKIKDMICVAGVLFWPCIALNKQSNLSSMLDLVGRKAGIVGVDEMSC